MIPTKEVNFRRTRTATASALLNARFAALHSSTLRTFTRYACACIFAHSNITVSWFKRVKPNKQCRSIVHTTYPTNDFSIYLLRKHHAGWKKDFSCCGRTTLGVCIVVVRQCASYGVDGDIYEKRWQHSVRDTQCKHLICAWVRLIFRLSPLVGTAVLSDGPLCRHEWNNEAGTHEGGDETNDTGLVVWSRGEWKRL